MIYANRYLFFFIKCAVPDKSRVSLKLKKNYMTRKRRSVFFIQKQSVKIDLYNHKNAAQGQS